MPGESTAGALKRVVDFMHEAICETVLQAIKLDNPSKPECPHFTSFCERG